MSATYVLLLLKRRMYYEALVDLFSISCNISFITILNKGDHAECRIIQCLEVIKCGFPESSSK